ncbi:YiiX/YebB-like N1pC/P60 family cysteine hydrolase [Ningiella sp. W23]|uniref:YiiX/YebB-like N1pC/P60 family cysteine hydrolase n=1 Tax=Ningiella sp. W23 TaxID=3023715 RepID=UPI003757AD1C
MDKPDTQKHIKPWSKFASAIGARLASFLTKPRTGYRSFSTLTAEQLRENLKPGDLILVEGNSRVSSAIKYITQSTWSHVCMYIGENTTRGDHTPETPDAEQTPLLQLLEADLTEGVITSPLDKYDGFNLRICRPVNLSESDTQALIAFAVSRLGHQYDKKNIVDLMRYLMPTPPIPQRFRRGLLEFGSGDPTKAICSTLVAQSFQSISYPILPIQLNQDGEALNIEDAPLVKPLSRIKHLLGKNKKVLSRRHYSHYTPRDFDLSPYFEIIKPTIRCGFDYKQINWAND